MSWNKPFSTEVKTEVRGLRRYHTHEHGKGLVVYDKLYNAGYTVNYNPVQPNGPGTGYSHWELKLITKGDDWERAAQFEEADKLARE